MAVLDIITEGDDRLRQKSVKVRKVDDEVRRLGESLLETIHSTPTAIGLAAPQCGILRRVIAIHFPEGFEDEDSDPVTLVLANPEIIKKSGHDVAPEGCLSIPGWSGDVVRYMNITVKARDMNDREVRIKASNFLARALQHEIDHLDGILFVDRVTDKETLHYDEEGDYTKYGEVEDDASVAAQQDA